MSLNLRNSTQGPRPVAHLLIQKLARELGDVRLRTARGWRAQRQDEKGGVKAEHIAPRFAAPTQDRVVVPALSPLPTGARTEEMCERT